jgi:plasmid stability protein
MATLTVKGVPDKLHRRLKALPWAHGRSLSTEIVACLEARVGARETDPETILVRAASLRSRVRGHLTDSDLVTLR